MGIDAWTHHSTYRGIVIQQYTESATGITTYAAYTSKWVMSTSLSAVRSAIDAYLEPEPEPEPEPHWEYHSTYRGIQIQVWMPDGTPFTAFFNNKWYTAAYLSTLKAKIDDFLEPTPTPPTEVSTTLSMSAPSSVIEDTNFNISGILTRNDTGGPIPNSNIALAYNGMSLGSAITGVDGDYLKTVRISTRGSYTLRASYGGTAGLVGSEASKGISISTIAQIPPWMWLLGGLIVGGSVWYVMKRRK